MFVFSAMKLMVCLHFQQKLKEEREAKRSQLDERHNYILQTVADSLGLEYSEVEDAILEGTQVFSLNTIHFMHIYIYIL